MNNIQIQIKMKSDRCMSGNTFTVEMPIFDHDGFVEWGVKACT
jgi:hypothetical protein